MQISIGRVSCEGLVFKQFLGYHCLLVDVMDIGQVVAKGACFHSFPTLVTLHIARVPFASCNSPTLHPLIGLGWKLGPDLAQGAYHPLSLGGVGLKSDLLKQTDEKSQRILKESCIPRCEVCIVDIEDGKEG